MCYQIKYAFIIIKPWFIFIKENFVYNNKSYCLFTWFVELGQWVDLSHFRVLLHIPQFPFPKQHYTISSLTEAKLVRWCGICNDRCFRILSVDYNTTHTFIGLYIKVSDTTSLFDICFEKSMLMKQEIIRYGLTRCSRINCFQETL